MLDQNRVLGPPLDRRRAEYPVLPGSAAQFRQTAVHTARVGFQDGALLRGCRFDHGAGDFTEMKQAGLLVLLDRHRAKQFGQLARGQPP